MNTPLRWALGLAVTAGFWSVAATSGLDRVVSDPPRAASVAPSAATKPVGSASASAGPREQVLNADLRGHYYASINIEGATLRTMVDTGASYLTFSAEDASALRIAAKPGDRTLSLQTANGVVKGQIVRLPKVSVGSITVTNVEAVILPPGTMKGTLLGMSFLRGLKGYEVSAGRMIFRG